MTIEMSNTKTFCLRVVNFVTWSVTTSLENSTNGE